MKETERENLTVCVYVCAMRDTQSGGIRQRSELNSELFLYLEERPVDSLQTVSGGSIYAHI